MLKPHIPDPILKHPTDGKHYTFIDLFAGIGGFRFGFEPTGGICVWSCEIDRHSRKTYSYNHHIPIGTIFPDVRDAQEKDIPDHDALIAGFACFTKDTMVLTRHGYLPIQHIRPGTLVLTHKGRWRPVVHVMRRENAPTREIRAQGTPSLITTDEHPFYTRDVQRIHDPGIDRKTKTLGPPHWTEAGNLQKHQHIAQVLPATKPNANNQDFWWLIGRYLAQGHRTTPPTQETQAGITIPSKQHEKHELATRIRKAGYEDRAAYRLQTAQYIIADDRLNEWTKQFGEYPQTRKFNQTLLELEQPDAKALMDGYISAKSKAQNSQPGHKRTITSGSKTLALELALLVQRAYEVTPSVVGQSLHARNNPTGTNSAPPITWTISIPPLNRLAIVQGQYGWKQVKMNEPTGRRETVWNLSVQEDQSYVADGAVVHNCEPFSKAGVSKNNSLGRPHGFAHQTRGTLFFDVIRILASHRPRAFLLENVPHLLNHDNGRTYATVRFLLEQELGYHISHRIIDARPYVPQRRRRIFIAGHIERDRPRLDDIQLPDEDQGPTLAEILHPQDGNENPEPPYTHGPLAHVGDKYTLGAATWQALINHRTKHSLAGNGFGYSIASPDEPTRTLTARYWKDGQEILIAQEDSVIPRRLTPRECSRLMGMPHLRIPVSDTQAYRQLGHSVVPPLVETLADFIMA